MWVGCYLGEQVSLGGARVVFSDGLIGNVRRRANDSMCGWSFKEMSGVWVFVVFVDG